MPKRPIFRENVWLKITEEVGRLPVTQETSSAGYC